MNKQLNIGILGTRGIPNRYGGFEQCAEYLALGLTKKGHNVWVYSAHNHEYTGDKWRGVNIIHCNDPEHKFGTFGQFIYDLNCIRDARRRKFDILLQLGYTSNSIWHRYWPKNMRNIVNMDGLEWKRSKYNKYVQQFLKRAERWAAMHGDILIADSIGIQKHIEETYHRPSVFIPYGAPVFDAPDTDVLKDYDLQPFRFYVLLARMEPENNIEMIIKGFLEAKGDKPLIVIGKTDNAYGGYLKEKFGSSTQIRFVGAIYDTLVTNNLRYYSLLYFHGHSVGGTNPSLLEAMGCSALIAAHDNIFNRAVLGDDAFYFDVETRLTDIIRAVDHRDAYQNKVQHNLEKIRTVYNWDRIVDEYEKVFLDSAK